METADSTPSVEEMTFLDKLVNVFTDPGEVFGAVSRTGPTASNWLLPWLISVAVSIAITMIITGNPSLSAQLEEMMRAQYDRSMEQAIVRGEITSAEAETQFEQWMSPHSPWFIAISIGGALLTLPVLFGLSFVFFMLGKAAMSASAPYMKVAEVVGLTYLIESLGELLTAGLMVLTDSINASFGPSIFITDFDRTDIIHVSLARIHLFRLWTIAVLSVGLSHLFQRDFLKVLTLVGSLWILWIVFWILWDIFLG